jgi:hypothetical protein
MLIGITKEERHEFISSFDTTDPKTVFVIGNMSARVKVKIAQDALAQAAAQTAINGQMLPAGMKFSVDFVDVVLAGLKEIRSGDTVIKEITEEVVSRIPVEVLAELAGEVMRVNIIGVAEKKN